MDFIVAQYVETGEWLVKALEINLRQGGTTHPLMTTKLLTNGELKEDDGLLYAKDYKGNITQPKYYVASDNLESTSFRGLVPMDLLDIMRTHNLHFNHHTQVGVVFHLLGCLSEFGKIGVTCIANSAEEAHTMYQHVTELLHVEGSRFASLAVQP